MPQISVQSTLAHRHWHEPLRGARDSETFQSIAYARQVSSRLISLLYCSHNLLSCSSEFCLKCIKPRQASTWLFIMTSDHFTSLICAQSVISTVCTLLPSWYCVVIQFANSNDSIITRRQLCSAIWWLWKLCKCVRVTKHFYIQTLLKS